jgi:Ser/Thr protein kinase RdoA (MazF antagonist)
MIPDDAAHRAHVTEWLAKLQRAPADLEKFDVIGRGISGAYVYRVRLPHEEMILKITESQQARYVIERSEREAQFYCHLAGSIPLSVPALLARCADVSGIALLLSAHQPTPAPSAWSVGQYVEVAEQLARLHAAYWNATEWLLSFDWLRRPVESTPRDQVEQAWSLWGRLSEQQRFQAILTLRELEWICHLLSHTAAVDHVAQLLPLTLCHGDCNAGNLLVDTRGEWIWADWQEVGIGRGPEDLAHFCQRASHDGGMVPWDEAVAMYHRTLEADTGERISVDAIRRVMDAAELRTRMLHWPAYLSDASPRQLEDMICRMHDLASAVGVALQE